MNKKLWQSCQIEVVCFDEQDVITYSMPGDTDIAGSLGVVFGE